MLEMSRNDEDLGSLSIPNNWIEKNFFLNIRLKMTDSKCIQLIGERHG